MMRIFIISGEASGDLHGANLVKEIKALSPDCIIEGWGGDKMSDAGVKIHKHYRELAFMGFAEVIANIRTIMRNFDLCKSTIAAFQPDTLVLIDYPGFNLRMAEWAHQRGIRVVYYISPQIWAWKQGRIKKIKKFVDEMCVVLPFEKAYYANFEMDVHFVGHPLLDEIKKESAILEKKKVIALLPGSRKQEISTMLPIMLEAMKNFPGYTATIAGAPGQDASFYEPFLKGHNAEIVFGKTYDILKSSSAGLITSGTATLEGGIFKLPQIVCYKGNPLSYFIARQLVKIKYISLVNLILDKPAVKELIQYELTVENITKELKSLLENPLHKQQIKDDYDTLERVLGSGGASRNTAMVVLKKS
jgi:lipid-A-disaccharide synthase